MIVDAFTGILWRWIFGAILEAVDRGKLHQDDPRIVEILEWMSTPDYN